MMIFRFKHVRQPSLSRYAQTFWNLIETYSTYLLSLCVPYDSFSRIVEHVWCRCTTSQTVTLQQIHIMVCGGLVEYFL